MSDQTIPVDSFGKALPLDAVSVEALMPIPDRSVLIYIEDLNVAIKGYSTVGWYTGTKKAPMWWSGVPGQYINLTATRWTVTHWTPLSGDGQSRAAIEKATGGAA